MNICGIAGRAGSGKDTFAEILVSLLPDRAIEIEHFARPIKTGLAAMMGVSMDVFAPPLKDQSIPWLGATPRYLMQTLGTEWGRDMVADDFWIRLMERRLEHSTADMTIIADVRMENEAAWIRKHGGIVYRMVRPLADSEPNLHRSEQIAGHPDDVAIYNAGSIEDLEHVARHVSMCIGLSKPEMVA